MYTHPFSRFKIRSCQSAKVLLQQYFQKLTFVVPVLSGVSIQRNARAMKARKVRNKRSWRSWRNGQNAMTEAVVASVPSAAFIALRPLRQVRLLRPLRGVRCVWWKPRFNLQYYNSRKIDRLNTI